MKMDFVERIGFLGLLGIVILIIIYLLKPNYQQKTVSSTFVWKQSLKYRKKRLPINRFRNLLILLCQILIITICAFLLAQPFLPDKEYETSNEQIAIVDASASMLAMQSNIQNHQETEKLRFVRAVEAAEAAGRQLMSKDVPFTLIVAGESAYAALSRSTSLSDLDAVVKGLLETEKANNDLPKGCTYGSADMEGALEMASEYLVINPAASVHLYTATDYNVKGVTVENVAKLDWNKYGSQTEWNAAILDVRREYDDGFYHFYVDVAMYNRDDEIEIFFEAFGVNGDDKDVPYITYDQYGAPHQSIIVKQRFDSDNTTATIKFDAQELKINSYHSIHISVDQTDSFLEDNNFWIYGSAKQKIKIAYVSPDNHSDYFKFVLGSLVEDLSDWFDFQITLTSLQARANAMNPDPEFGGDPTVDPLTGFDLYIYEQEMPKDELGNVVFPTDGALFIVNPMNEPGFGIQFGRTNQDKSKLDPAICYLYPGEPSGLMLGIEPRNIYVSRYTEIIGWGDFTPLMYFQDSDNPSKYDPVLLHKNQDGQNIMIMPYATWYSGLVGDLSFPMLIWNMIECLMPVTLKEYHYGINEKLQYDQRFEAMSVLNPKLTITYGDAVNDETKEPIDLKNRYDFSARLPGKYAVQQTYNGIIVEERFFVKIISSESDFTRTITFDPIAEENENKVSMDLFIYFAAALVALVFIERLLHVRDEF